MNPYLSIVVVGRNDSYGYRFIDRTIIFLKSIVYGIKKYKIECEIVFIEWNPPAENEQIVEVIRRNIEQTGSIRIITVPNNLHCQIDNSNKIKLFEYIAKNCGILRAKGDYVLITNPDIIFSDTILQFIAIKALYNQSFYRVDRVDVPFEKLGGVACEAIERSIKNRGVKYHGIFGSHKMNLIMNLFEFMHKNKTCNYMMRCVEKIHTNASGDFILASRNILNQICGFPEIPLSSYCDGYMCFMLSRIGLSQVHLCGPFKIYHMEHDRNEQANRPSIAYDEYLDNCKRILVGGIDCIKNKSTWGLSQEKLKEELW